MTSFETMVAEARLKAGTEETLAELRRLHPSLVIQMVSLRGPPAGMAMLAEQTSAAKADGALLADRPEVDLLLRIAGTTQIADAISKVGYRARGRRYLVAFGSARALSSLRKRLAEEGGFKEVKPPASFDRMSVEEAALLAVKKA